MANGKELLVDSVAESFKSLIPKRTERMFHVFLKLEQIFPGGDITYEADPFTITNADGTRETTIPDHRIIRSDGKKIYIEVTKGKKNGTDPKGRERRIMKLAAPDVTYVVLYNNALKFIQRKYEGYDFFKEEKKRKKDKESSLGVKSGCVKIDFSSPINPSNFNARRTR
jgi:hypothetical protein